MSDWKLEGLRSDYIDWKHALTLCVQNDIPQISLYLVPRQWIILIEF